MNLDEAQRKQVADWIAAGAKLAEIQTRLAAEFGIKLTYMEARFLVDDLKLTPKDPEPPKVITPPAGTPTNLTAEKNPAPEGTLPASAVSVSVDQITKPGTMISGSVKFSDGQNADWYFDQTGRVGLAPKQQGYKPTEKDLLDFQVLLREEIAKLGY